MEFEQYLSERLLCKNKRYLLCYDKGCLIVRNSKNKELVQRFRLHSRIVSFSLLERLLRHEPRAAFSLDEDTFIFSNRGHIFCYSVKENALSEEHTFAKGMNNPLNFCVHVDKEGVVEALYGEYIWNIQKDPVAIYKRFSDGWKEIYSFPEKRITHIHNIVFDEYRNSYLILTGDEDLESIIWQATLDFSCVKYLVGGQQKFRACIAFPTEECIYYATDTPLEQNWICMIDNNNSFKKIYQLPGPCIFGTVKNDYLYVATSVEGDPSQGKWKYRFCNKLGKGVQDRKVHILRCDKKGEIKELGYFRKDCFPMWLFEFGNVKFPNSDDEIVYMCPQSTVEKGTFIARETIKK